MPAARILTLDSVAPFALAAGVQARALFGDATMLNLVELEPGAIVPEHSHPHEQMGIVISGEIVMIIEGDKRPCHAMDAMHIPSGVVHGACTPEPREPWCSTIRVPIRARTSAPRPAARVDSARHTPRNGGQHAHHQREGL